MSEGANECGTERASETGGHVRYLVAVALGCLVHGLEIKRAVEVAVKLHLGCILRYVRATHGREGLCESRGVGVGVVVSSEGRLLHLQLL